MRGGEQESEGEKTSTNGQKKGKGSGPRSVLGDEFGWKGCGGMGGWGMADQKAGGVPD